MNSTAIGIGLALLASAATAEPLTWDSEPGTAGVQSGPGTWSTNVSAPNWQDAADANVAFDDGDDVTFGSPAAAGTAVDLDTNVAPGSITFDAGGYVITDDLTDNHIVVESGDTLAVDVTTGSVDFGARFSNQGTIVINGGATSTGTVELSGSNSDFPGPAAGLYQVEGGEVIVSGSTAAEDNFAINGGTLTATGTIGGNVDVAAIGATFDNETGGNVGGLTSVNGGSVNANGGAFTGGVQVNSGDITVTANTDGDVTNAVGTATINDGATLTGDLTNESGDTDNSGAIIGGVSVTGGTFDNGVGPDAGSIEGTVTVDGGTLVNGAGSDITGTTTIGATEPGSLVTANGGEFDNVVVENGEFSVDAATTMGNLTATGGIVDVDADLTAGDVTIGGATVDIAATTTLTGDFSQTAGGTTINTGATLGDTDGTANVSGGTVTNDGTIDDALVVSGDGVVTTTGTINGLITLQGDGDGVDDGTLIYDGGTVGAVIVDGGVLDINAALTTDVTVMDGNVDVEAGDTLQGEFEQSGGTTTLNAGATLDDDNGSEVSGGALISAGAIDHAITVTDTGEVQNNTGGSIAELATIDGGTLIAGGGTFADDVDVQDGTFDVNATTSVANTNLTDGDVTIAGGTLTTDLNQMGGTVTVESGGTFDDNGAADWVLDAGTFEVQTGGTVVDEVVVEDGGTLNVAGGDFTAGIAANGGNINFTVDTDLDTSFTNVESTVTVDPSVVLTGDVTNSDGDMTSAGQITGALDVTGGSFTQTGTLADGVGGQVTVSGAGTQMTVSGGTFGTGILVQSDSDVSIDGAAAGDVDNDGGTVTITGTGNLDGDLTNTSGDTVIASGGRLDGDLFVDGGDATISGTITGDGANAAAVVAVDGSLTTNFGSNIQGTTSLETSTLTANGGIFGGTGIDADDSSVTIDAMAPGDAVIGNVALTDSNLDILADGTLRGDVTLANLGGGTSQGTNAGTLDGSLNINAGTFTNEGNITTAAGNVVTVESGSSNSSSFILNDGTVGADIVVNAGTFTANGGTFATATANTATTGTVSDIIIADDATGDVVNDGGVARVETDATLTGNVTSNDGTTTIDGAVTGTVANDGAMAETTVNGTAGTLNVTDGDVITNTDSHVSGQTSVSGGTATLNGGTFTGGIRATDGTTNVAGTIAIGSGQELIADEGDVTIATTGVVNGNVATQNSDGRALVDTTNAGRINGNVRAAGNTFDNAASGIVSGEVAVSDGSTDNAGTVLGGMNVSGGEATNTGRIENGVDVSGTGSFELATDGIITGASTVAGDGTFDASGGEFNDGVTNNGGDITVSGGAMGNIFNTTGEAEIASSGTLMGDVDNGADGALTINGRLDGALENDDGQVNAAGIVDGTTLNTGADARLDVASAATFNNTITNQSGADINVTGTLTGDITNTSDATVDVTGGMLIGDLTNAANATFTGAAMLQGTATNSGTFDIAANDSLSITGGMTNADGGTLNINSDASLSTTTALTNAQGGTVNLAGEIAGDFINAGEVDVTGSVFSGDVTNNNTGRITLSGDDTLNFDAGLAGNGGIVDVSTNRTGTDDTVQIAGDLTGNHRFIMDIDLSDPGTGTSTAPRTDIIVAEGAVDAGLTFDLQLRGSNGQPGGLKIFDSLTGDATYDFEIRGLPDASEAVIYTFDRPTAGDNAGDLLILDAVNPGIGGLAGSIVLTQSLIGSVINRPSSPFVSGLAYDDPNPCGVGAWTRGVGGQAESSGEVTELIEGGLTLEGEISADYVGLQLGGDLACFNGYFDGWDISFGGIGGFNEGTTEQPVFGLVGNGSGGLELGGELTSVTSVDFDQTYGGVYLTGAYNRFSADLQYRVESTDFVANNVGVGGLSGLGLTNSDFSSEATTFSGQVSYAIPFGETDIALIPTAGFAYTDVSTGTINFDDGSTVEVDDFTSETLFAGATLARTSFGDDGVSATNQFATFTFYNDFADSPTSLYTPRGTASLGPRSVEGENLGGYAEISAGLNYLRILPIDAPLGAKQFSTSLRGDLRASDQLSSWGITSQIRIQF